jgi:rare lipoprotein A
MPAPRARSRIAAALLALLLAACATAPRHPGFYRGDGPPASTPPDLARTPDAVPRDEPLNAFANRPYVALGQSYAPDTSGAPFRQRGIASWYGRQFQGNRTASGETYDMFAMTAAHPTLPIPSYARVTSLKDGRAVVVRINDRGPFLKDRIIDLSYAAAVRLGLAAPGSGEVEVERILPSQYALATSLPAPPSASEGPAVNLAALVPATTRATTPVSAEATPAVAVLPVAPAAGGPVEVHALPSPGAPAADPIGQIASSAAARPPVPVEASKADAAGAAAVALPPAAPTDGSQALHWSVQLGAFAVAANADALRDRLALLLSAPDAAGLPAALRSPRVVKGGTLARVLVGSSPDRALALQWARQLERFLGRPTALYSY